MLNTFLDALILVGEVTGAILLADKIKTKLSNLPKKEEVCAKKDL